MHVMFNFSTLILKMLMYTSQLGVDLSRQSDLLHGAERHLLVKIGTTRNLHFYILQICK